MDTYQDNMTLDEVADYDLEMTKDAVKNANRYRFNSSKYATLFVGACIKRCLIKLGIPDFEKVPAKKLDKIQKKLGIKIEHRVRYEGEDAWRSGIYIYKKDVLVGFISEVQRPKLSVISSLRPCLDNNAWFVITNVK